MYQQEHTRKYLDVPFNDNSRVKELGAWWDPEKKSWYIPPHIKDSSHFKRWFPESKLNIHLKAPLLFVLYKEFCWKCGTLMPIVSLAADQYETITFDDDDEEEIENLSFGLFHYVKTIPDPVSGVIAEQFPFFQYKYSNTLKTKFWLNVCPKCKAAQGDHFIHCEMGEGFGVTSAQEASKILIVETAINAVRLDGESHVYSDSHEFINEYAGRVSLPEYIKRKQELFKIS